MRVVARLALLLTALAVAAGGAELLLRALGLGGSRLVSWQTQALHRPDSELIYSLSPGARSEWINPEFVERVHINSDGMRDRETRVLGPEDRRILVLGDSMTFGHGVGDDETFPNQLEALFRREGREVDVINAGVRGFGTDHELRYFSKRLRALQPDLLILAFYENDISDGVERPLYALREGELVSLDATRHRIYRIGRLYDWLPEAARASRLCGWLIPQVAGVGAYPEAPRVRPPELIRDVRHRIVAELAELAALGRTDGFRVLLLGVPYRDMRHDEYQWLHGESLGEIDWLDLSGRDEWQREKSELFFKSDEHLTVAGNLRLAEQLHRHISENDLL